MFRKRATHVVAFTIAAAAAFATDALAVPVYTAGAQTALPPAQPAAAAYTLLIAAATAPALNTINQIGIGRDDTSEWIGFDIQTFQANQLVAPYNGVAVYRFVYRQWLDAPGAPNMPAAPTAADVAARWAPISTLEPALRSFRTSFNTGAPVAGNFLLYVDPATALAGGLYDSEFYKFEFWY